MWEGLPQFPGKSETQLSVSLSAQAWAVTFYLEYLGQGRLYRPLDGDPRTCTHTHTQSWLDTSELLSADGFTFQKDVTC